MPETPLSTLVSKPFLNGDGTVAARGDVDLFSGLLQSEAPFSDSDVKEILVLDIKAAPAKKLRLGDIRNIAIAIKAGTSVGASLDVIRIDDLEGVELLKTYGVEGFLDNDTMYLALRMDAEASVGAALKGKWAQYGLAGSFGIEAGGDVHFAYLRPFALSAHTAGGTLKDYLGHLRLPQNVRSVQEVPIPGEVLWLTYGGYLNASAEVSWGYSMTRSGGLSIGDLDLKERLYMEAKAKLGVAFAMAGNFEVEVRRARPDDKNWARVTVKKARSRAFEFAADLDVKADLETDGLPDKPSEFLEGILSLRATDLLREVNDYVDQFTDADPKKVINKLKAKASGLARQFIDEFSNRVVGKPLDKIRSNEDVKKFHGRLVEIKEIHDQLGAKVVGFLEDEIGSVETSELIENVRIATNDLVDSTGLQKLTDGKVWRFLEVLVDRESIDLIENTDGAFDELKVRIKALETANLARLQTFIEAKRDALNLGPLLEKLVTAEPADLQQHVSGHLEDLLHRLTGIEAKDLEELSLTEIRGLQKQVKNLKAELKTFSEKLYGRFQEALNRSYELSLAYRYRTASESDALLDVEINLAAKRKQKNGVTIPSGAVLMRAAVNGDFSQVFKYAAADRILIRKGVLSHKVTRSRQLSVNVFGWQSSRFDELITGVTDVVEQRDGGVLHVYGIDAKTVSSRRRREEEMEQTLAFSIMAKGFEPVGTDHDRTIDAVTAMSSSYGLRMTDKETSRSELREYLAFAERMGLIPAGYGGVSHFLDEIAQEMGVKNDDFGSTTLKYRLQHDATELMSVFKTLSHARLADVSRQTLREVAHFAYTDFDPFRGLADAYVEPAIRTQWKTSGLKTGLPGSLDYFIQFGDKSRRIRLSNLERILLNTVYRTEDDFVEELLKLDAALDKAAAGEKPRVDELRKRLSKFVGFQKELNVRIGFGDRAVVPPLIAVLNRLSMVATKKPRTWKATLELKFKRGEKSVTRLLIG